MIRLALALLVATPAAAQEPWTQPDFPAEEFAARHDAVFDAIGKDGVALVQGAADTGDLSTFRQSNQFYYLSGVVAPGAMLLLDGQARTATLYLPPRDAGREKNEGMVLSVEDAELAIRTAGVDAVKPMGALAGDLSRLAQYRSPAPTLYTPLAPAEIVISRDTASAARAIRAADPWDGGEPREGSLKRQLEERFPRLAVADLSPVLDAMRLVKSPREIALVRRATEISGLGLMEAMRSTASGVTEAELDAAARHVFWLNGAQGEAYASIIGGGQNAYVGHYWRKGDRLVDGDMLLMDWAPDYRYYKSDVARMWPVNGRYTDKQRHVADFILAYRDALIAQIRPGVTSDDVLDQAAATMRKWLDMRPFAEPALAAAAEDSLKFRGHFQHSVGLSVHDVGGVRGKPLEPGMIFTIDPMLWLHDEKLYFRIEDMVLVTANGHENLSAFVPSTPADIEETIAEEGLLQSPLRARWMAR